MVTVEKVIDLAQRYHDVFGAVLEHARLAGLEAQLIALAEGAHDVVQALSRSECDLADGRAQERIRGRAADLPQRRAKRQIRIDVLTVLDQHPPMLAQWIQVERHVPLARRRPRHAPALGLGDHRRYQQPAYTRGLRDRRQLTLDVERLAVRRLDEVTLWPQG